MDKMNCSWSLIVTKCANSYENRANLGSAMCISADALKLAGMALAPIGLPNCNTACGDVHVPYPFGFGHSRCYLPGFDLTCDTSHNSPRLLLGRSNNTLQVVGIFLNDSTVRVIHDSTFDITNATSQEVFDVPGRVRYYDEDKQLSVHFPDHISWPYKLSARNEFILTGCNVEATLHGEYSNTTGTDDNIISSCVSNCTSGVIGDPTHTNNKYCSGRDGCCHAHIPPGNIDECKIPSIRDACFGDCNNVHGSYKCRCPRGTRGDPNKLGGYVKTLTGLTIGLLAASGPALLLLLLGVYFTLRKVQQRRIKLLRQKYFKQNRGQLLQQLVSQRADIAERMVITVDELAKATNNFDKARELGGGGHGTVYKGILSDQHVVAIKKSKIAVQKEINEFINEVAILSQVNHRNVVKLLGCCLETEVPLLVYEFISNGTLYHHLHVEGPISLSWSNRLRIATETANALSYLHSSVSVPIIHRDIKSSNILLDDALTSKVSDFGASRYIPVEKTGLTTMVQGTIGYLDPMCFYTGRLNEKSDVYSFGVILVELLTRKKPFSYLSSDGDGLVMQFANLHGKGNLTIHKSKRREGKKLKKLLHLQPYA
ncbi:hypothetical protein EJB05_44007, partial [Eragrostis curvula]